MHDYSLLLSADNPINFKVTKAAKYDVVDFLESPLLPVEQRKVDANSPGDSSRDNNLCECPSR